MALVHREGIRKTRSFFHVVVVVEELAEVVFEQSIVQKLGIAKLENLLSRLL